MRACEILSPAYFRLARLEIAGNSAFEETDGPFDRANHDAQGLFAHSAVCGLTYFFCYLDRINVGFAALTMNKDIGLDAAIYGMAAGAFFWGYVLFEVPSNIILEKVGARLWIARIMITWGLISGATAFATGPYSFMAIRFLLGLAEAGLFPGFVLYFTYWFPDQHRARINSGFTLALPIAVAMRRADLDRAAWASTGLWGLKGWQCMYLLEAIPTVLIGVAVFFFLTDRPDKAHWLDRRGARVARDRHHRRAAADRGAARRRPAARRSGIRRSCCCR